MYLEKLKEENIKENLMYTFWCICAISNYDKYILKIERSKYL